MNRTGSGSRSGSPQPAIRLALRQEDSWIVAYLARPETMDGAKKIAVLHIRVAESFPDAFERWKSLLSDFMLKAAAEVSGIDPSRIRAEEQTPRSDS